MLMMPSPTYLKYILGTFFVICFWTFGFEGIMYVSVVQEPVAPTKARFRATTDGSPVTYPALQMPEHLDCHVVHSTFNSCNVLPNYFIHSDYRARYQDSIIIFWHLAKTGGSTVEQVIADMYENLGLRPELRADVCDRLVGDVLSRADYWRDAYKPLLKGHTTHQMCDFIHGRITNRSCSVFTIFREPFSRVVSHFFYARTYPPKSGYPTNITEWFRQHGSPILQDFDKQLTYRDSESRCKLISRLGLRQKRNGWVEWNESRANDLIDNFDKHFSLIGLTEDLSTTFEMLEEMYQLPFVRWSENTHELAGQYDGVNKTEIAILKKRAKEELLENSEARRVIGFDVRLYARAREVFLKQKEEFLRLKRAKHRQI